MPVGDILFASINPTAWQLEVAISGMPTGGIYSMGFGSNNSLVSPTITLNVLSSGYDDFGNETTLSRIVYGTTGIRLPFPNELSKWEIASGNNSILRVSLSDFIYAKDSNITANFLSGFYVSGNLSSNSASLNVVNNSAAAYPKVIGNWSWPDFDIITGNSYKLRCVAFHKSAQQGRPIRTVKFIANDEFNNYHTGYVNNLTIDSSMPDQVPVPEYIYDLPTTGFVTGSVVTGHFIAYPWYGDAQCLANTYSGYTSVPNPFISPKQLLNDRGNNYVKALAIVDAISGNNSLGQAIAFTGFNPNSPPPAYATINSGVRAVYDYNLARGRADVGGGTVYVRSGNYGWVGGTTSVGSTPKTCITIAKYPGQNVSGVILTGVATATDISDRIKVQGITIANTLSSFMFHNIQHLWFDQCEFNSVGQATLGVVNSLNLTHCKIIQMGSQGIGRFATNEMRPTIVRGCDYSAYSRTTEPYTFIGNKRHISGAAQNNFFNYLQMNNLQNPFIIAYNKIYSYSGNGQSLFAASDTTLYSGFAMVQNIFEGVNGANASALVTISADGTTGLAFNNAIIWHNNFIGGRVNLAYNDRDGVPYEKREWSIKNNIFDDYNIKSDMFLHPNSGRNGARTGNWSVLYGVGQNGNVYAATSGQFAVPNFNNYFVGLNTVSSGVGNDEGVSTPTGFIQYISLGGAYGNFNGSGNGNYQLREGSPANGLPIDWVLPFDIDGNPRYLGDAAGAYSRFLTYQYPIYTSFFFN